MQWVAPTGKDTDNAALEKRLWDAADQFRANSGLKSQEYSAPVLGLIFLRFAEVRFTGADFQHRLGRVGSSRQVVESQPGIGNVAPVEGDPEVGVFDVRHPTQ